MDYIKLMTNKHTKGKSYVNSNQATHIHTPLLLLNSNTTKPFIKQGHTKKY